MNVKTVKTPDKRFSTYDIKSLNIQAWGDDNLYPHEMDKIVANSETGDSCLSRYIRFIKGNGFKDFDFASEILNARGETADDLLHQIARDLGSYDGFAIHFNFDVLGNIVEMYHIPFENCRLTSEDENGKVSKIAVFPDWTATKSRGGRKLRPRRENIDYIDTFNPRQDVVQTQIEAVGGIENYKGQILWISNAGYQVYPKPIYDRVITHMSTEEGLANIAYRNTRNNFNLSGMLVVKKGQDTGNAEQNEDDFYDGEDDSIARSLGQVQGDIHTNKIIVVNVEHDEDIPQFVQFQGANYDKDYTVTANTTCEKIYSAFNQETFYRFRQGAFGLSSDIIKDAYSLYSSETRDQRLLIERIFEQIFAQWKDFNYSDFEIEKLTYDVATSTGY